MSFKSVFINIFSFLKLGLESTKMKEVSLPTLLKNLPVYKASDKLKNSTEVSFIFLELSLKIFIEVSCCDLSFVYSNLTESNKGISL